MTPQVFWTCGLCWKWLVLEVAGAGSVWFCGVMRRQKSWFEVSWFEVSWFEVSWFEVSWFEVS